MKHFICVLILLAIVSEDAEAKIRRIGFFGIPLANTDYSSLDAAHTAANPGDTILVFPSVALSATITKKLIILGPGTWLDPNSTPKGNANQQAFAGEATIASVTFSPGSQNSVISGFKGGTIFIATSDITVRRNAELTVYITSNSQPTTISNLKIQENYRVAISHYYDNASTVQNLNVSNNLILSFNTSGSNNYNGNIANNIWSYDATSPGTNGGVNTMSSPSQITLGGGAYLFQNNILLSYYNASAPSNYNYFIISGGGNTVFNYNLISQSYNDIGLGTGTGNVIVSVANIPNVFTDFPLIGSNSADNRYKLKANSPAAIANRPGSTVDAGMYGGPSPYKLSTLPAIPSIYSLSSPDGNNPTGNSIQINLSTKGNN